jgi:hypothetical protein
MSTKTNSAVAAYRGVLGTHGFASAQEGSGNHAAAQALLKSQQQPAATRPSRESADRFLCSREQDLAL